MKITKVLTTAIFTTLLINLGTAQTDVITIPDSGDTLEMEIESGYYFN